MLRDLRQKTRKSVMSRLAPLSLGQRLDLNNLMAQGIPEAEARAIAQGYAEVTKADRAAKNASRLTRRRALVRLIGPLEGKASKTAVLGSEAHVDVPMGSNGKKKETVFTVAKGETSPMSAEELAYIKAALLQVPTESPVPDAQALPPEQEANMQANRLVAGMDAELDAGAQNPEDARRRASRMLLERTGHYDAVGVPPEVRPLRGLMLDLGSGARRAKGWLGLDLYAYDHGTVLHDLDLGLPFPDGSVRAIRLCNSLHDILDGPGGSGDPIPLLQECQRVLMEGGRLYYEGPEPLFETGQKWPLPGLILRNDTTNLQTLSGQPVRQTLERVPLRVPAYHGADPLFSPAGPLPLDVQMALAAYNTAPADTAMANLVHKSKKENAAAAMRATVKKNIGVGRQVRVVKTDKFRQVVLGVVLEPDTVDTQGDMMSPEDIEASAHAWLASSRVIGSEHGKPIEATPVESYIAPVDFNLGGELITKGSWLLGTKIHDPAEWAKVLDGEYEGYSVGGFGERE